MTLFEIVVKKLNLLMQTSSLTMGRWTINKNGFVKNVIFSMYHNI